MDKGGFAYRYTGYTQAYWLYTIGIIELLPIISNGFV